MYPEHIRTALSQMKQYGGHTYKFPGSCGRGGTSCLLSDRRKSTHRYFPPKTKQNNENMNAGNGNSNEECVIPLSYRHQSFCQFQ